MPPAQVWAAASGVAAELLGVAADHGTLEGGKVGDVVVIDGAPDDLAGLRERVWGNFQRNFKTVHVGSRVQRYRHRHSAGRELHDGGVARDPRLCGRWPFDLGWDVRRRSLPCGAGRG